MTSSLPIVSVIIPSYNSVYIAEAITSVLEQTYPNIETIVIDDGSTDHTLELISSFSGLKVLRNKNRGVSTARNEGLKVCKGEFISFLDSDDVWVRDKIKRQVAFLLDNIDFDLIYGRFLNYFQEGVVLPKGIDKEKFLNLKTGKLISLGTLMVRREVFHQAGYFDQSIRSGGDLDWFIKIRELGIKTFYDDRLVMRRRLHATNLSYESRVDKSNLIKIFKASIDRKRERGKL